MTVNAVSGNSSDDGSESVTVDFAGTERTFTLDGDVLADNDELAESYIESVFGIYDETATVGNYGESNLTDTDLALYKLLKKKFRM